MCVFTAVNIDVCDIFLIIVAILGRVRRRASVALSEQSFETNRWIGLRQMRPQP